MKLMLDLIWWGYQCSGWSQLLEWVESAEGGEGEEGGVGGEDREGG